MFQTIISTISSFMYSKLLVIILIGAGVYFTVRTRFPQVRLFKNACGSVMEKPDDKGAISSFQALMVSTASRVGTGNIVGGSSAICIGGFGSVFWMWVIAIIGGILAVLTGWCLLGGGSRIVKVTSMVVPVMGIAYIGISLLVVIINIQNMPAMFVRIF